ncbi:MAG: class I SAM-dependent methyltransferase [Leptolyngbyaceae cyanobacterium SM2_5_2]|nr:class I SAM-dependent methyltransferase [Leptolyngbyaceae cyanobacterium SM2_5_2]
MPVCWCGNEHFIPFNAQYHVCNSCGTLVSLETNLDEKLIASDGEDAFYGKDYWLAHQDQELGLPNIYERARHDLTERNLHWLRTLLRYRLPPADVMELGCSHGGFVAALQQAGYCASGIEVSPWVVEYGHETFQVPIYLGPLENLDLPINSLDCIVLMDVLEHLERPLITLECCAKLLMEDGFLVIQTPRFNESLSYQQLLGKQAQFLQMLIPNEHLFLFSERSINQLLNQLGFNYIYFEPAIFSDYDMFLIAAREPLKINTPAQIEAALLTTPKSRFLLALLDVRARELDLINKLQESEHDRACPIRAN